MPVNLSHSRTPLNIILLILFIAFDIVGVCVIYTVLFSDFASLIPKHSLVFNEIATLYYLSVIVLYITFIFFALVTVKIFPHNNITAAASLFASIISIAVILFTTEDIKTAIYLSALIEMIGLFTGFIFTTLVPVFLRDEFMKNTFKTMLPAVVSFYLVMLLIEFELYGYLVFTDSAHYGGLTVLIWLAVQIPVVWQRSRTAYQYYTLQHVASTKQ